MTTQEKIRKSNRVVKPKDKEMSKRTCPSKSAEQPKRKMTPKRASPPKSVRPQKRSKRIATTITLADVADMMMDTPPNSPAQLTSSTEDVICLTSSVSRHKPFADFDIISGRHPFTITV